MTYVYICKYLDYDITINLLECQLCCVVYVNYDIIQLLIGVFVRLCMVFVVEKLIE